MGFPNENQALSPTVSGISNGWHWMIQQSRKCAKTTFVIPHINKYLLQSCTVTIASSLFLLVCLVMFSNDESVSGVLMQRWREVARKRGRHGERGGVLQDVINILSVWPGANAHVRQQSAGSGNPSETHTHTHKEKECCHIIFNLVSSCKFLWK